MADEDASLKRQLAAIADRFVEVGKLVTDPEVVSNPRRYAELMREYRRLEPIALHAKKWRDLEAGLQEAESMLEDADMAEMAEEERSRIREELQGMRGEAQILLLPKDEADERSVMLEIRAGTGGDEAALFAGDLYRMYARYAENRGWRYSLIDAHEGTVGGYKEIVAEVQGEGVYGILKFESGVHRVQRVPATESQGRVHTSAATVAVLPVADEVDVSIDMKDVRRDTFRASGAGGQHVNKTESAVRLTHLPSGIVVECQDGRSQHANFDRALEVLRTRLYEQMRQSQQAEEAAARKTLVSTGDRSAKIRTYNFPQGRVTDHRIGLTSHALPAILGGDLQAFSDALRQAEQAEQLRNTFENTTS